MFIYKAQFKNNRSAVQVQKKTNTQKQITNIKTQAVRKIIKQGKSTYIKTPKKINES